LRMAIIGVDIDLTVVASDDGWFDWANERSTKHFSKRTFDDSGLECPYDFSRLYKDVPTNVLLDYWRQSNLYDNLKPLPGSVDVLRRLSERHSIVFVTALKGDHHKSKFKLIERNFPFMAGFIGTKEKHMARVDMLIDDRVKNLHSFCDNGITGVVPVLFDTIYSQDTPINAWDFLTFSDWTAISPSEIEHWLSLSGCFDCTFKKDEKIAI
jgi:5'(3')-deoxyribonucleotidase